MPKETCVNQICETIIKYQEARENILYILDILEEAGAISKHENDSIASVLYVNFAVPS